MHSKRLLFNESVVSKTQVRCELQDGVDPAEWSSLCKRIGGLRVHEFGHVRRALESESKNSCSGVLAGIRRLMSLKVENDTGSPIVSIGPGRIGDANQFEL